jgi:membrane fusion protein, multidrug efflux system
VEVQGGPAPFTCTGLVLGAPASGAGEDPATGGGGVPDPAAGGGSGGGTTARCAVPPGVTVFAGMGATVQVQAGIAENVLVVPITAVQGSVQTGNVWVVGPDGTEEERAVTLGLTDGDIIEVREGLAEGDQVLQFVPVPDDTPIDPMTGGPIMGGPYG